MNNALKRVLTGILTITVIIGCAMTALAHQGRTDSRGGHKDNKNVSGLGSYHYHCGDNPAHLHTNGVCPYSSYNTSEWTDNAGAISVPSVTTTPTKSFTSQQEGVIGSVVTTDIKAFINGAEIPAYNVEGNMVIIGADLRSYGFDVVYDNTTRTSSVSLSANGGTWDPIIISTDDSIDVGTEVMSVYETDITMLVNGVPVTGYNVEGRMAFRFAELEVFGSYYYDNDDRSTNLWIEKSSSIWTDEVSEMRTQTSVDFQQQDTVIGSVFTTDIRAYINGAEIPAYNVDGNMVVIGADLRYYGFEVVYDNTTRTSNVSLAADGGTWDPIIITTDDCLEIGTEVMSVYETDITMSVNGTPVTGYNIEGRMAFRFAELAVFGSCHYNNEDRSTYLWIE